MVHVGVFPVLEDIPWPPSDVVIRRYVLSLPDLSVDAQEVAARLLFESAARKEGNKWVAVSLEHLVQRCLFDRRATECAQLQLMLADTHPVVTKKRTRMTSRMPRWLHDWVYPRTEEKPEPITTSITAHTDIEAFLRSGLGRLMGRALVHKQVRIIKEKTYEFYCPTEKLVRLAIAHAAVHAQ